MCRYYVLFYGRASLSVSRLELLEIIFFIKYTKKWFQVFGTWYHNERFFLSRSTSLEFDSFILPRMKVIFFRQTIIELWSRSILDTKKIQEDSKKRSLNRLHVATLFLSFCTGRQVVCDATGEREHMEHRVHSNSSELNQTKNLKIDSFLAVALLSTIDHKMIEIESIVRYALLFLWKWLLLWIYQWIGLGVWWYSFVIFSTQNKISTCICCEGFVLICGLKFPTICFPILIWWRPNKVRGMSDFINKNKFHTLFNSFQFDCNQSENSFFGMPILLL